MASVLSFALMAAFFVTHELDAFRRHEWRMLPLTRYLPDKTGERVLLWSHVPLALFLFWVWSRGVTSTAAVALSGFAVLHVGLHWLFRKHPRNEFSGLGSWSLILGAGFFGALHMVLVL